MMDSFFAWIEQTPLSIYVREDLYAFFVILIFHSLGMAFLAGGAAAICLRVLGVASGAPLQKFRGFFPVMRAGLVLAVVSGVLLLIGYPAKALTNPVFVLKFAFLIAAGVLVWLVARRLFPLAERGEPLPPLARWMAAGSLLCWAGGIFAGRFLAYTHTILMVS
jgi:zinc transporter ZupT